MKEITEVIVYSLKKEHRKDTKQILSELHAIVDKMDGMIKQSTFVASQDENTFMDIIRWESTEAVSKAKEVFETEPDYARIAAYFDDMEYFKQFTDYQ